MPLLNKNKSFTLHHFSLEIDFEKTVENLADYIFGPSSIYISKKKRMKGSNIISIPDGYLIDVTDPTSPKLFIIENEIVAHDAFEHIGIQLLKFATSFHGAKVELKNHLMSEIASDKKKLSRLENACKKSNHRNIDNYLDSAVFGDFKAIVLIDEAREELHNVIQKINANISVLELRTYKSDKGEIIYQYDTLYDEEVGEEVKPAPKNKIASKDQIKRSERRAKCDTIVVPAQKEGFQRQFVESNQWFAIRIGAAMKERIKYIAAYQVAPISAVTHVAEVDAILPYENTGKYLVKFKSPAKQIRAVKLKDSKKRPQAPVYIKYDDLKKSKYFDELISY